MRRSVALAAESHRQGPAGERFQRRYPAGAEVAPGGGVSFRVWAPRCARVEVELSETLDFRDGKVETVRLDPESDGYFEVTTTKARVGSNYRFKLPTGVFPDPASRYQPRGPHGPSEIIDPSAYRWQDARWEGVRRHRQVIYEMHVGTFTPAGTWAAAGNELEELAAIGITLIELMPVADFPGRFGWGYDGVNLFAPTRLYGRPDDFRAFVDRAHGLGLGVILDVVYNHLGPDGNYLREFSTDYFTDRYRNEWGDAVNFDGANSGSVRELVLANAAYWVEEFHLDGLRLDATQQMFDESAEHILAAVARRIRAAGGARQTYLVAENEPQQARLVRPIEAGGCGIDALWNDDFHHSAVVALTGHYEAYYGDYRGTPQEFVSAAKWGYLYQGQWYARQKKRRGSPTFGIEPERFVNFLQNHDQIANSLRGKRGHQLSSGGRWRALTTLLLLGPGTPMLFQGQEFAASSPFLYFAEHHPELARQVADGRRAFLRQFSSIAHPESDPYLNEPGAARTFEQCKLDFADREKHAEIYRMHKDLLKLRREDPVFSRPRLGGVDGAVLGPEAFVLRYFGAAGQDRLLVVNLGRDLELRAAPEPLLAPVPGTVWAVKWSSESPVYGGSGTAPLETEGVWRVMGEAAMVLAPEGESESPGPKEKQGAQPQTE